MPFGFEPIGEEWPSVYIYEKLQLVLVVCVDDFKVGRKRTLPRDGACYVTLIEPETDLTCALVVTKARLSGTDRVTT